METSLSNPKGPGGTPNKPRSHQRKDPNDGNNPNPSKTKSENGGGRGSSGTDTGSTEVQESPRPNLVIQPPPEGSEPKQKRNRPSGLKYDKSGKNKAGAATAGPETVVMAQSVLQGLFAVVAARAGAHWAITEEEAEAIATPAANIISRYIDTEKMAKYSDPAALVIALGVVLVPRVMISITKVGGKLSGPKPEQPSGKDAENSRADSRADNRPINGDASLNVETDVAELLRLANSQPY